MDVNGQVKRVDAALADAERVVRSEFEERSDEAFVLSYDLQPGVWETAEAVGIVRWLPADVDLLAKAVTWLAAQHKDGGFRPAPDVSSRQPYVESSTRVLLSLVPACKALGDPQPVRQAIEDTFDWLIDTQNEDGGWGARRAFRSRMNPTSFAVQALSQHTNCDVHREPIAAALEGAHSWFAVAQNPDGGFGLDAEAASNVCSSGHAAWAHAACRLPLPSGLTRYLETQAKCTLVDIPDEIDDPSRQVGGRFQLLLLAPPLALIGLVSAHVDIYSTGAIHVVDEILARQRDGVWWLPNGRHVWPTYFHVAALRLWRGVHSAYDQTATVDFSGFDRRVPGTWSPTSEQPATGSHEDLVARIKNDLSSKNRMMLAHLVTGKHYAEIALAIQRSERTVEWHAREIRRKLRVRDDWYLLKDVAEEAGCGPDRISKTSLAS